MGEKEKREQKDFDKLDENYNKYSQDVGNFVNYTDEKWELNNLQNKMTFQGKKVDSHIFSKFRQTEYDLDEDVNELEQSYDKVKRSHQVYLDKNERLKTLLTDYNTKIATMNNFSDGSNITIVLWIIVLVLLFIVLIMTIIEDKKEMNMMYRILFAIIIVYLVKLAVQDLGGYIQREL